MSNANVLTQIAQLHSEQGRKLRVQHFALEIVVGLLEGAAAIVLLPLISAIELHQPISNLLWLLAGIALLTFVVRYFATMRSYLTGLDFIRTAHQVIGNKLAILPLGWFHSSRIGGLSRLVSERFMTAAEIVAHLSGTIFSQAAALFAIMIGVWFYSPVLGATFLGITPIAALLMLLSKKIREHANNEALPAAQELSSRIVEFAAHQPALRTAGRVHDFEPLLIAVEQDHRARVKELWKSTGALLLNGIVLQFFVVAIITVTVNLASGGGLSVLNAIVIIGVSLRFAASVQTLGEAVINLDTGRLTLDEAQKITQAPVLPEPHSPATGDGSGSVRLDHVGFAYGDKQVLSDVSFDVQPHTMTAIVGPSGSGKTTIARLIARFWDVDAGKILVDGVDIRQLGTPQLMSKLSMVFQDVYLFDDTLRANVLIGKPGASDEELDHVAALSGVTEIVKRIGWDSGVGEGGKLLSGGERQRVSIARALLKQTPIVLFDEATSALDAENEQNVLASIQHLRSQATCIVIAHKLDTIAEADQIVVLDKNGEVTQIGTHEDLMLHDGQYRHFWQQREAASGWTIVQ